VQGTRRNCAASYIPAFDGLRGIAAVAVVLAHCSAGHGSLAILNTVVGLGALGVDLFFALSGFLITGILLRVRDGGAPGRGMAQFGARRALRIFPLYFAAVAVYVVLGNQGVRENIWWFVTYTVNIGKSLGVKGWAPLNHFWTLAVEEQFYALWPILVLACPARTMGPACLFLAGLSFATRCALEFTGANDFAVTQLTLTCLEPLALGSWFAVKLHDGHWNRQVAVKIAWAGLVTTIACMTLSSGLQDAFGRAAHALLFAPLLPLLAQSRLGRTSSFLCSRPLRFLGTISYGLYVWHAPVIDAVYRLTPFDALTKQWPPAATGLALFGVVLPASIGVAFVSWITLERVFLRLKSRFQ
jgi:peptidoglycan/LPS O-acetylase OafA/YrhL